MLKGIVHDDECSDLAVKMWEAAFYLLVPAVLPWLILVSLQSAHDVVGSSASWSQMLPTG